MKGAMRPKAPINSDWNDILGDNIVIQSLKQQKYSGVYQVINVTHAPVSDRWYERYINVNTQTLFQSEEVATGSSAASAILLAAMTRRMDISKYLRFTT